MQVRASMYPRSLRKTIEKVPELSSSAIIYHWAIKGEYPALDLHNIFFSPHYKREFEAISKGQLTSDPTIYVYISSKNNSTDAPVGHENWFVMVNAPVLAGQNWEETIPQLRQHLVNKINKVLQTNIEEYIEAEGMMTPEHIANWYSTKGGSIYGNASNNKYAAFYRHANFSKRIKGLYFVGVTVHPGGGIPLALNSAKIAVKCLEEDV
jgi:phytoene dehydrogenase-like protein